MRTTMNETYDQVFSMNSDGSGVTKLTDTRASCLYPAWSPGREYIAFERNSTIYVMETTGEANGGRTFTVGPSSGDGLDWSPDGQSLVFVGPGVVNTHGIWIVAVDPDTEDVGTPMLTIDDGGYYTPCFSPDGSRIAYSAGIEMRVFDLDTGQVVLSIGGCPTTTTPSWSPDGNYLASSSVAAVTTTKGRETTTAYYYEIFVANADGSGITQVPALTPRSCGLGYRAMKADARAIGWPSFQSPEGKAIRHGAQRRPRTIDLLGRHAGVMIDPSFSDQDVKDIIRAIREYCILL